MRPDYFLHFHNGFSMGKVTLICCMDTDFDVMTKLSQILSYNSVKSVTVVKTDKLCCADLSTDVIQAVKSSRLPVPVQVSTVFIQAEDLTAAATPEDTAVMLSEMASVGVTMAVWLTAVWVCMVLGAKKIVNNKSIPESSLA